MTVGTRTPGILHHYTPFRIIGSNKKEKVRKEPPWTKVFAIDIIITNERISIIAMEMRPVRRSLNVQENGAPEVEDFKLLGSTFQEMLTADREVKNRIQTGWNRWKTINGGS